MTYKFILSVVFFLGAASAHAALPALPQVHVDTTMPSTSVTKTVCARGCDYTNGQLQNAIDDAVLGTKILLQEGFTYTPTSDSGFILKNKTTGNGWIIIQTKTTLPAEGTRVLASDAKNYAKIVRPALYAISCEATAHHYRLIGIEFMNPRNADTAFPAAFVNCDGRETSLAAQTHHILFDRIYMHGPPTGGSIGVKFGLVLNGQYQGVIDSTILDITYGTDAQAIGGWGGAGPFLIRNNFLSSSGENYCSGGGYTTIPNLTPSDITITKNHMFKPLKWRDDPAYSTGVHRIIVKNLIEFKHAQRVLVDGNIFENVWPDGQTGSAILFTPRQGGSDDLNPWTIVQDITVTNNIIKNSANTFALSGQDTGASARSGGGAATLPGGRYLIKNNLIIGQGGYAGGTGLIFQIGNGPFDVTIQHNTIASFASTPFTGTTVYFQQAAGVFPPRNFVLQDNLFVARNYPVFASGGCTASGIAAVAPGYVWTNTVFAGPWPTPVMCTSAVLPRGNGNAYPAGEDDIQYLNPSGGDYSLAVGSPYRNAASDGTDIGVNWSELRAAQEGNSIRETSLAPLSAPSGLRAQ